jgi:hypothetical protein
MKCLEDALKESKNSLENSSKLELSVDKIATSPSHAISTSRIMFVKPSMSNSQTHENCRDKGKNISVHDHKIFESKVPFKKRSIPTCHHYGIVGHTRPKCFQIRSQKPWNKQHVPRKDEPGIEKQVRALSEQVQIISKKFGTLTSGEKNAVMISNKGDKKNTKDKQVSVKKKDNLCLFVHTPLSVLSTCLWYLDSECSNHMTCDKTLLKKLKMGKGGKATNGDGSQSKVIEKGLVEIPRFPISQEALYVEGLKANLLSISQLCDNDLVVQFWKKECNIFDVADGWRKNCG